jgi:hypothetical protein
MWWFGAHGSGRLDSTNAPGVEACYLATEPLLGAFVDVFRTQLELDMPTAVRKGTLRAQVPLTVTEPAADFIARACEGRILDRAGTRCKPSSIRNCEGWLEARPPATGSSALRESRRVA